MTHQQAVLCKSPLLGLSHFKVAACILHGCLLEALHLADHKLLHPTNVCLHCLFASCVDLLVPACKRCSKAGSNDDLAAVLAYLHVCWCDTPSCCADVCVDSVECVRCTYPGLDVDQAVDDDDKLLLSDA